MVAQLERHTALSSAAGTTSAALQNAGVAPLECPRCESTNTKFCYYNNYSLAQPRHFCKACKRYWTRGGTLRNVPVGGGCRKNKRTTKTRSTTASYAPRKAPPSANSLPPTLRSAAAATPFLYGLPPENSANNLFLSKSDLHAQLAGYEENFQLSHAQHSTSASAAFLGGYSLFMNSDIQLPSSSPAAAEISYHPLLFYDYDHLPLGSDQSLGFIMGGSNKSNISKFAEENPIHSFGATAEPTYLYWNHAAGSGWPEPGPSAAPLH